VVVGEPVVVASVVGTVVVDVDVSAVPEAAGPPEQPARATRRARPIIDSSDFIGG